ncbi:MAG: hypothetical protein D8M52_09775 [Chlorobi bacterium]|nr:hypothetical protein [Chlorobiota bacterium]MCC6331710.1 OmpA family protein [Ignavibacteria bacterium]WKZ77481.1 MAG: OmpA family protein [Candidatus Kapabacteria bacterium]MBV6462825.1 hypothetical protein [Chlorobiota bacterium]MCL4277906.1 OmpA family protein [Ignavibacteria bacterium]
MKLLCIVLCFGVITSQAQPWVEVSPNDVLLTQIGFSVHGGIVSQGSDFTLPFAPTCCTAYGSSLTGTLGISASLRQELSKAIRLQARVTYLPMNGTFDSDESILVSGNVDGVTRHTLETSLTFLGAELLADVKVAKPVRVLLGASIGSMVGGEFDQRETLIMPGLGTFENGMRVRNETRDAALQSMISPAVMLTGGLAFDIPMSANHDVVLSPEILLNMGITDVVESVSWRANIARVGASVSFALNAPEPPLPIKRRTQEFIDTVVITTAPDQPLRTIAGAETMVTDTAVTNEEVIFTSKLYRTDTIVQPQKPELVAAIHARGRDAGGTEHNTFTIRLSTQFVSEALPLLPVVFFESQAVTLSSRYHQVQNSASFSVDHIPPTTTAVHREVLNIIGSRLNSNPTATITLRGTADPTTEAGNCSLARDRAQAVRDYLVQVWKVDPNRIHIAETSGNCAPARATREQSEYGYSENRRVEIETSDLTVIEPVAKRKFSETRTVDPPLLVLDPSGSSTRYVTGWTIRGMAGADPLFTIDSAGSSLQIVHALTPGSVEKLSDSTPLMLEYTIRGIQNSRAAATVVLPVQRDTLEDELQRLTLTLFDVSSDELTNTALQQIRTFVKGIPSGSKVVVRGFTDLLGNADFNRQLAQRRAGAVCSEIQRIMKTRIILECTEISTDKRPPGIESNQTPEERFLSRTVQIEVTKKR